MGFLEDVNTQGCQEDWGAQGKYKNQIINDTDRARSGGRNFESLHALRCVLGTSEAPFLCTHAVNTYPKVAVFVWQLQNRP